MFLKSLIILSTVNVSWVWRCSRNEHVRVMHNPFNPFLIYNRNGGVEGYIIFTYLSSERQIGGVSQILLRRF